MVAQYQQFVEGVRKRAGLANDEDARQVAVEVLEIAGGYLTESDRDVLSSELPSKISRGVHWRIPEQHTGTEQDMIRQLGSHSGVAPERARYLLRAVLSEIESEDEELADRMRQLPSSEEVFTAPGEGPPPDWAAAGADDRPRPLDAGELDQALRELVDWSGSTEEIHREVRLPRDRFKPLINLVKQAEDDLSHHATIDQRRDSIMFALATRSLNSVTQLDLRLARRIDEAVFTVGSGG